MENNKLHILVVDDDDRIRGLLKDYEFCRHHLLPECDFYYFPSIIFFNTSLNLITESELELFKALNILFF